MKRLFSICMVLMLCVLCTPAHADIFGERKSQNLKMSAGSEKVSASYVDPQTILDYVAAIAGYLGTREGGFYDFDEKEFGNYLAATLYTIPDAGVSFNIGMLNLDGVGATVDWNIGAVVPSQNVPLLTFLQYLYIGGGAGYRNLEQADGSKGWELSPIVDAQFKFSF